MIKADNGSSITRSTPSTSGSYYYFVDGLARVPACSVDKDRQVIGRTGIYDRNISLVRCHPLQ